MANESGAARLTATLRNKRLKLYRDGPLARFVGTGPVVEVGPDVSFEEGDEQAVILSAFRLQDAADYRRTLQSWFGAVRVGGHLIVLVPHAFLYERQLELPTTLNPCQRRLYTPGMLMAEVEESLAPNSYRVRLLNDDDSDYDYAMPKMLEPTGHCDILLVIEKIEAPAWQLDTPLVGVDATPPDYAFEPQRTRVEVPTRPPARKILILKLDHLGDFIMGLPALEKARRTFVDAQITLVVGSWNVQMARDMAVADHVISFDAFPRNSTEEEVDVPGRAAVFRQTVKGEYDLAIDLRTDLDTRVLLRNVKAGLRAGIGTRAQLPFLDIFLPLDFNRNEPETAREYKYNNHDFISQGPVVRHDHRSVSLADSVEREWAIIWGPYHHLRPGTYFFDPWFELAKGSEGMLLMDIAINAERVTYVTVPSPERVRLHFTVQKLDARFEFRIFTVDGMPSIDFSFFGGRLMRAGAASVLHQSEYLQLLIELVQLRLERTGVLAEVDGR